MLGASVGNYVVTAKIGEGGMGAVYLAHHVTLGRRAAVKVLLPELANNRELVARFLNEAKAASQIRHPSIVEIYDFGYLPDVSAYITMEFLDGESLAARRKRTTVLDPVHALDLARQICGALAAAHDCGIIHRDLKPDNVFLLPDPEAPGSDRIKVLDFGIAKLATQDVSQTQTGSVLGTPTYMSPEQCRGAGTVDARADLYALGCVLFELVTGRPPFMVAGAGELIAHHLYFEPPAPRSLIPELPEACEQLILALLRKEPSERPATAREVIEQIDQITGTVADLMTGTRSGPVRHASYRASAPSIGAHVTPTPTPSPPTPLPTPLPTPQGLLPRRLPAAMPTPTTLSGASGARTSPPARSGRWVIGAVATTLSVVGVAIVLAVSGGDDSVPPAGVRSSPAVNLPSTSPAGAAPLAPTPVAPTPVAPTPVAPTPPASPPPPVVELVTLTIDSEPHGAQIVVDGKPLGVTPYRDTVVRGSAARLYTIRKDGYETATMTPATERSGTQRILLTKRTRVRVPQGSGVGDKGVNPFDD